MSQSRIQITHLNLPISADFGLKDINYEFNQGNVYAILGESGCGKSTLLRAIAGLYPIPPDTVSVDGIMVSNQSHKELSLRVGYMPQNYGLFPHLSVERNVSLQAELIGWSKERIQKRLREMMDLVLLPPELLQKFPSRLSGGQRQRVALMRCMFLNQPIFLFDEPLSALDPKTKKEILTEWKELFTRLEKLVIIVTHSLLEAKTLGDQILVMEEGELKESGSYQALSENPQSLLNLHFRSSQ